MVRLLSDRLSVERDGATLVIDFHLKDTAS